MRLFISLLIISHLNLSAAKHIPLLTIGENWTATIMSHTDMSKIRSKNAELRLNYQCAPGLSAHAHIGGTVKQKVGPSAYIGSALDLSF